MRFLSARLGLAHPKLPPVPPVLAVMSFATGGTGGRKSIRMLAGAIDLLEQPGDIRIIGEGDSKKPKKGGDGEQGDRGADLEPTPRNLRCRSRECDPDLYGGLAEIARGGERRVESAREHAEMTSGCSGHSRAAYLDGESVTYLSPMCSAHT